MPAVPATTGIPARFTIERQLGAGAFGTVFVVNDAERNQQLALKRLERVDPASIYRFKQEFRALADVKHPNLVHLHELFALDSGWCFTMDLVDGVRFDAWIWGLEDNPELLSRMPSTESTGNPSEAPEGSSATTAPIVITKTGSTGRDAREKIRFAAARNLQEQRLRDSLKQMVEGVLALHAAGILHRDLKPSNVLVTREGKVAILDFGMVATGVVDAHQSSDGSIVGTPAYMSPEQARGAPLTTASDWYAIGLMMYEALVGHLPFSGTVTDMIAARASRDPHDPRALKPNLPDDLCDLCMQLLARDPATRPSGITIARAVGIEPAMLGTPKQTLAGAFVGRTSEDEKLHEAFATTRRGKTVVVHVHGPSGHGKTTLIRRFLADLALHNEVVILQGRCYERESVPFKAVDDLVDALGRYLRELRPVEAAGFMPRDARALVRLFPSLGRLEVASGGRPTSSDPLEMRRRAFGALRELLARLSDARPVVLFLDDVHWGDNDSAALVRNLLAPPDVPPLLLIACYRGDGPADNELLRTLRSPQAVDAAWHSVDVPLGPLTINEARDLAATLMSPAAANTVATTTIAQAIAEESGGSPLFIAELVRAVRAGLPKGQQVSLQIVVADRVATLPESARAVLELLACSERPLESVELERAAGLEAPALSEAVDRLRDEQLINVTGNRGRNAFEVLHDKLRIAVRGRLSPETIRAYHLQLAHALEASADLDPESLAHHYKAGGDDAKAFIWIERAADHAAEAVAFDHAADLYRRALEISPTEKRLRINGKLAESLASAGRCADAAAEFLRVAAAQKGDEARSSRRRAGEQYLRAGHVTESYDVFGPLLQESGLANPTTPSRALTSLLWRRAVLKVRGLNFRRREESEIDPADLRRADFCWVLGSGLAGIDLVRSAHYHANSLHLSLKYGEPLRVVRALSMEAIFKSLESAEGCVRAGHLAAQVDELAEAIGHPNALGWAAAAQGIIAWGNTDLAKCAELCDRARNLFRERSQETFREAGSLEVWFALHTLFLTGRMDAVAVRAPALAREASARGDRYLLSTVRAYSLPLLLAAQDRVAEARHEADAAIEVWPEGAWYHQHWAWMRAMCFLDLYEGRGANVLERTALGRPKMQRSMQLRIRTLRLELTYLEGRGLLEAMVAGKRGLSDSEAEMGEKIAKLKGENNPLGSVYAEALKAGLAALQNPDDAAGVFARTGDAFDAQSMPMHRAAALWRQGQALGGQIGADMIANATTELARRGIIAPGRFADMLMPRIRQNSVDRRAGQV